MEGLSDREFINKIQELVANAPFVYDGLSQQMRPIIDIVKLRIAMNDTSLCSAFPIVCTAGSAWEVHATPLKSSIASWPWAFITRPVASPSLAASSRNDDCEWRFNDAATGFWAGYNPLRWSGKISLA